MVHSHRHLAHVHGSRLKRELLERLAGHLDWAALSVDSASEATHLRLGRAVAGTRPLSLEEYEALAVRLRQVGVRVKLNTVVTSINAGEDLTPLVRRLRPERWKVRFSLDRFERRGALSSGHA